MDLQALRSAYGTQDERTKKIIEQTADHRGVRLHLKGIAGSAISCIASAVYQKNGGNHVFVLNNREEAAYFLNDMEVMLGKKDILFIPDSFQKPGRFEKVSSNNILFRTEAIDKINHSATRGEIVVTYPEALLEKFVVAEALEKNIIFIKKGEKVDGHFITDLLMEHGFAHADFVYEPGQFSVRGGIIDIFSFGNELPYRVELFDNEVESIRIFDPATQLSDKLIAQVTIVPNIQTQFGAEQQAPLFSALPKQTTFWFRDMRYCFDAMNSAYEQAVDWYQLMQKSGQLSDEHPFHTQAPTDRLVSSSEALEALQPFSTIEFGLQSHVPDAVVITYDMQPQPLFSRNFNMLIEDLQRLQKERYRLYIFMSNARQADRFAEIFQDLQAGIQYIPIIPSAENAQPISAGFIDKELKLVCYTDHQIFERYHKFSLKSGFAQTDALTMRMLMELQPGDFVTHIDHGVGVYSGLEKIEINGQIQEAVRLVYATAICYMCTSIHCIKYPNTKERTAPLRN